LSFLKRKYERNISGFAAFNKKGKILLIRDRLGRWKLPGGGIEDGEGSLVAGKREFNEETGHKITKVLGLVCITEFDKSPRTYFSFIYKGICTQKPVIKALTPNEVRGKKFFSKEEVEKLKFPKIRSSRFKRAILLSFSFVDNGFPVIFRR